MNQVINIIHNQTYEALSRATPKYMAKMLRGLRNDRRADESSASNRLATVRLLSPAVLSDNFTCP